jgi:hypothetical protein
MCPDYKIQKGEIVIDKKKKNLDREGECWNRILQDISMADQTYSRSKLLVCFFYTGPSYRLRPSILKITFTIVRVTRAPYQMTKISFIAIYPNFTI